VVRTPRKAAAAAMASLLWLLGSDEPGGLEWVEPTGSARIVDRFIFQIYFSV
jgi:hypothetical protein